jgi:hypothetical protein
MNASIKRDYTTEIMVVRHDSYLKSFQGVRDECEGSHCALYFIPFLKSVP